LPVEIQAASGNRSRLYLCLPEPLRGLSFEELSLDEDEESFAELSFDELSFDELSFDELSLELLSDFGLSSFFSFEEESLFPEEPGDEDFLA
jgi:hypothetical protein